MTFKVDDIQVQVPMLVTSEEVTCPIIGLIVIREIMKQGNDGESITSLLGEALDKDDVTAIINLIQELED